MPDSVSMGVASLTIPTRTHLCGFFRGPAERDEIMFPFVREGEGAGDKCLCVFDAVDQHALESRVGNEIVDILRTHPKVLVGSTILDNIYYIEPDHLRPSRR
jgi:hypothetical protein